MLKPTQRPLQKCARLVVSFELAESGKPEGLYVPELTVKELLEAIEEYTRLGCQRIGHHDEDISNPFLCVVDYAIAAAAKKAVLALFANVKTNGKTKKKLKNKADNRPF